MVECLHECRFGAPKKLALGQQKTQPVNEAHEIIRNYNPPQPPRIGSRLRYKLCDLYVGGKLAKLD